MGRSSKLWYPGLEKWEQRLDSKAKGDNSNPMFAEALLARVNCPGKGEHQGLLSPWCKEVLCPWPCFPCFWEANFYFRKSDARGGLAWHSQVSSRQDTPRILWIQQSRPRHWDWAGRAWLWCGPALFMVRNLAQGFVPCFISSTCRHIPGGRGSRLKDTRGQWSDVPWLLWSTCGTLQKVQRQLPQAVYFILLADSLADARTSLLVLLAAASLNGPSAGTWRKPPGHCIT